MRIVAVADTHLFEADLGELPDGDVFVHAGDLCRHGTIEELALAAAWVRDLPHRHTLVIAGNHDWCFAREPDAARALLGDQTPIAGRAGCEDLIAAVRRVRPCLHLFGHVHTGGGLWRDDGLTYANVTTCECERGPTVLDLDLATRSVTEVLVPPAKP